MRLILVTRLQRHLYIEIVMIWTLYLMLKYVLMLECETIITNEIANRRNVYIEICEDFVRL